MEGNRPYYTDINYKPFLHYAVIGANAEALTVSKSKHHVEEFPDGLSLMAYTREQHGDYLDSFFSGVLGQVLQNSNPVVYAQAVQATRWAILSGHVTEDSTLAYLKNAVGIVQALAETGAVAVLDVMTLSLYAPEEFRRLVFEAPYNPYRHAVLLNSEEDGDTVWLHSRGMLKFGRPDISLSGVPKDKISLGAAIANQVIYYGAQGLWMTQPVKLHTADSQAAVIAPEFVDDFENNDFNNAYYRLLWNDCKITKE